MSIDVDVDLWKDTFFFHLEVEKPYITVEIVSKRLLVLDMCFFPFDIYV